MCDNVAISFTQPTHTCQDVRAWTDKGYEAGRIPLAQDAVAVVRLFAEWRASGRGGKGKAAGLSDSWIARKIDEGCARVGVTSFRMHDLRRTFATEAVRTGVPITVVSRWLGHKDIATTEGYVGIYRRDADVRAPVPPAVAAIPVVVDASRTVVLMHR